MHVANLAGGTKDRRVGSIIEAIFELFEGIVRNDPGTKGFLLEVAFSFGINEVVTKSVAMAGFVTP